MQTIYISGQISGLDFNTVKKNFDEASQLLSSIGLDPVNPLHNGLTHDAAWHEHMLKDIEMLFVCDGILMLQNWMESRGARIERSIAIETGKIILYESTVTIRMQNVQRVKEAIQEVMGLRFQDYTGVDKDTDKFFARIIFSYQCKKLECLKSHEVSTTLNRAYSNAAKYRTKYETEFSVNKEFRAIAKKVDYLVNRSVSE